MQYGTLIHAWMEQVGWLDEGLPEIERLRQAASQLDTTGLDINAQIAQFLSTLQQPNVSRLLSRASYAPPIALPFFPTSVSGTGGHTAATEAAPRGAGLPWRGRLDSDQATSIALSLNDAWR